jgi:SAM-dependent methyltransferase
MPYLFKDTDLAARRLRVLAEVFAPASRAFLRDVMQETPPVALDLGCGPGYTTRLLAEETGSSRVVGLDASPHFIELASANAPDLAFLCHDLTQTPFPTGAGDLLFCRMLLTHLQDPASILARWTTQLRPGGLLLLDEVEWIHSERPLFRTYLGIVEAMLGQQANQLYIGPQLAQMAVDGPVQRQLSRVYHLPVSSRQAATMFSLNMPAWKSHPFIQTHYAANLLEQLEQELLDLSMHATAEDEITWGMRQIAYQRM